MMRTFLLSIDLWSNIIGGFVAAILVSLAAYLWNKRKNGIMKDLIKIMGMAIQHRNIGEAKKYTDKDEWVKQAKIIEVDAIFKAKKLSNSAGALVEWLDRIPPWHTKDEVEKHVSILSTVIERIRGIMERNS